MTRRGWRRTLAWLPIAVVFALLTGQLDAMFMPPDTDKVPIDRVVANLQRQVDDRPDDIKLRLNLARIHAMAWADKSGTAAVVTRASGGLQVGDVYMGPTVFQEGFQQVRVVGTTDAAALEQARAHLVQAIAQYRAVLQRSPRNVIALLGEAWCHDQNREKTLAIAGYRKVIEIVWPRESAGAFPTFGNVEPTTNEVARYLIPLLDPQKDAAEIATLKDRVADVTRKAQLRAVTPVAVPLRDDLRVSDLLDVRARVTFDADGSGLDRRWTWITPDVGWLVFDKHGTGQITSALQWFGRVTFWLFWDDGYDAMRALDDNDDGVLSGRELQGLAIWRDANRNGVADRDEVQSLASWDIVSLSCQHILADDDPSLAAWSPIGVTFANGRTRPTFDVLLYPR